MRLFNIAVTKSALLLVYQSKHSWSGKFVKDFVNVPLFLAKSLGSDAKNKHYFGKNTPD